MPPSLTYRVKTLGSSILLIALSAFIILYQFKAAYVFNELTGKHLNIRETGSSIFFILYAGCGFLIIPLIINRLLIKKSLSYFGLTYPAHTISATLYTLGTLALLMPFIALMAKQPSIQQFYMPADKSMARFVIIQLTLLPIYYFAEEFFFRGFLFLGLWKKIGWHSYWITEYIFIIAHFGKPGLEIFLSIPAGVILSSLTLRTKSVYPAIFVHYIMGVTLNVLVTYYFVAH